MATKDQVLDLHVKHPDWTSGQIAEALRCTPEYVRATGRRNGMAFPRKSATRDSTYDLGLACKAAGLTLRDILDISEQRNKRT